jgi:hypothetical protein
MQLKFTGSSPNYVVKRVLNEEDTEELSIGRLTLNFSTKCLDYSPWNIVSQLDQLPLDEQEQINEFINPQSGTKNTKNNQIVLEFID